MKYLLAAIVMAIGFCVAQAGVATASPCAELWSTSCYGMSIGDVLSAVPQSVQKGANSKENLKDGAENLVDAPAQVIANEKFVPHFYFASGRLEQVMLELTAVSDNDRARLIFEYLIPALRAKYGNEISSTGPTPGILYLREIDWVHNGTNISMVVVYVVGTGGPTLNVVYQRRISKDAGKL